MSDTGQFQYLNLADEWPHFQLDGLVIEEGLLRLAKPGSPTDYREGHFLAGPFEAGGMAAVWNTLEIAADLPSPDCHLLVYTLTSDVADAPVLPWESAAGTWMSAPWDALTLGIQSPPGRYLWIAGGVRGDGTASPVIHQIKVRSNNEGLAAFLPAIYRRTENRTPFLDQLLGLMGSLLDAESQRIDDLALLFDPMTASSTGTPDSWLDWLAAKLDFELDEQWDEARKRSAVAKAFSLYGYRGTVQGLTGMAKLYSGVTPVIEELSTSASLWSLGETSTLGFTTMFAPAHAQGAVLGATATLGQSSLVDSGEPGVALLQSLSNQFCVRVYVSDFKEDDTEEKLRAVLDREKPAHTSYHLCVIRPDMRIGAQARVGIDTIVGGVKGPLVLDNDLTLGVDTLLAFENEEPGGAIGKDARVGSGAVVS